MHAISGVDDSTWSDLHAGSDARQAAAHFAASADAYAQVLQHPEAVGGFAERCDVRYNYACACCLAGRHDAARQVLTALVASDTTTAQEIAADADLKGLLQSAS